MAQEKQDNIYPTHCIGIGASAGGLEALQIFLKHLPRDTGASYVVVQHLSPDHKSMMAELLKRYTDMPIHEITDGILLEHDHIYLVPPRKNLMTAEGKLYLSDFMPDGHVHMPIDVFLRSLAEDQQHRAIGIVLSGTGSDGTRGIKALKEAGGLVIIQEPSSAKFDGMPISAFNTGLADLVLPPEEMGESLVRYINHPSISGQSPVISYSDDEDEQTLNDIFELLKEKSSINFTQYKASTVARRIERRLGINQLNSIKEYFTLLAESPREVQILSKELLIGVTRFFRDDKPFLEIKNKVIPSIVEANRTSNNNIRVWIAGCSTGEEAYSIAIMFDEEIRKQNSTSTVKVFATDVDEDAISEASSGQYARDIEQDVSPERLEHYFTKNQEGYEISREIRQTVIFSTHNMIEDPPFSNVQLVSCRNVLIYFQHAAQKKVFASLYFALQKNGYLFLGSSESLGEYQHHFEVVSERSKIFQKVSNRQIPLSSSPPQREGSGNRPIGLPRPPSLSVSRSIRAQEQQTIVDVLERLVKSFAPDCIVINESFDAVHVYGDVTPYTRGIGEGKISNHIKDLVVEDLSVAISTALYRCEKNDEDVFYKDVQITNSAGKESKLDLSILVVKCGEINSAPRYYVVQFIPSNEEQSEKTERELVSFDVKEQSRQRIADLEQELVKKQEHLQVIIEELETTNEELQSANEELMAANEELQSTNEELQSVNEELYTVNSEYQEKITELTEANNDLDSVITATDIGIVFLDDQLTIRKFTPKSEQYINFRFGDVGRPFHHISHELAYDGFLADIASVSAEGTPIEKHVFSHNGHAVLVRTLPYRRHRHSLQSGVLITLTNISRLRFVENALQIAQEQLRNALLDRGERLHKRITRDDKIHLLVLDDDEIDRKRIAKMLENIPDRHFSIAPCATIDDAVSVAKSDNIDVCLVDFRLSEGTAKDFVAKLRELEIGSPLIILSGYSEIELDFEFLNADIFDFLNKDELSSQLLVRSIDYVLERQDMHSVLENLGAEA